MPRLAPQEQERVARALAEFGKPVDELTLGQMVGLYRKTDLLETAGWKLGRDLSILRQAGDWIDLRNRAAHPGGPPISPVEA